MADMESVWMYDPSFPLAVVGTVFYAILFIVIFYQTMLRYRAWFFSVVVVGAAIEVVGYAMRIWSVKDQTELVPFIMTLTLIVIAPVFIAAGDYLLISRLIRAVLPQSHHRIFGIPGRFLTPIFVVCDIVALAVQGNGSGVASSNDWQGNEERIGRYILVGGLAFQLVIFAFFMVIFRRFHVLANRYEVEDAPSGWRKVVTSVYISSVCIMIRTIFRLAEFAEGHNGYAFRTEWPFWVFEAVPMIGAIGVFCLYHPSRYLGRNGARRQRVKDNEDGMDLGAGNYSARRNDSV